MVMYTSNMPSRYSIAEARANLPKIIDLAAGGHEVELTRRGQAVAVIVSTREIELLRGRKTGFPTAYRQFLARFPAKGSGIDKDFARTLRDRSPGRGVDL